jgi:hypothetical protein
MLTGAVLIHRDKPDHRHRHTTIQEAILHLPADHRAVRPIRHQDHRIVLLPEAVLIAPAQVPIRQDQVPEATLRVLHRQALQDRHQEDLQGEDDKGKLLLILQFGSF